MNDLRKLVWFYLILLVFEGALRKWIVPALDAPLLIVRDPLVIWIYFQALRQGLRFNNAFFIANLILAIGTTMTATLFGWASPLVTAYGLRTDYLQVPLIFLLPQILNRDDVIKMGRFFFALAIPMAVIMALQFKAPQDSFINKGTMATQYETVRPSGTFSFVTGVNYYFAICTSFLLFGYLQGRIYKIWEMVPVLFAILLSAAVSGSRTEVASIMLVGAAAIFTVIVRGKGAVGVLVAAVVIGLAIPILSSTSLFKEGSEQMQARFVDAQKQSTGANQTFVGRFLGSLTEPLEMADTVPFFGYGLGLGTNVGLSLYQGKPLYWPELEWDRLFFETGPAIGLMLCLFRTVLFLYCGKVAFDACRHDNILPLLLFASCGLLVLNGQWGVPMTLGFSIFIAGLTLAACQVPDEEEDEEHEHEEDESSHSHATDVVGEAP